VIEENVAWRRFQPVRGDSRNMLKSIRKHVANPRRKSAVKRPMRSNFLFAVRPKDKASRSKFIAKYNVGSLWCVDRLGSFSSDLAAVSMNESRQSSTCGYGPSATARQRHRTRLRCRFHLAGIGPLHFRTRASPRLSYRPIGTGPFYCAPRRSMGESPINSTVTEKSTALTEKSAMDRPQGASAARLSTAGEGPVLCLLRDSFRSIFLS